MRDGVEDYDALRMLQDLVKQKGDRVPAQLRDRARKALTLSPEIYDSMTKFPADAGAMVERRRLVNELIVLFLKQPALNRKRLGRGGPDDRLPRSTKCPCEALTYEVAWPVAVSPSCCSELRSWTSVFSRSFPKATAWSCCACAVPTGN
jgi:hypothetical protein